MGRGAGLWGGASAPQNPGCLLFGIYPYFSSPDVKDGFYFWSFERKEMQGFFGGGGGIWGQAREAHTLTIKCQVSDQEKSHLMQYFEKSKLMQKFHGKQHVNVK